MIDILLVTIVCLIWGYWRSCTSRPKNYPPGPKWLPILGNQLQLRRDAKELGGQHFVFKRWMKEYNSPVIGLKLGSELVVVGMTYPIVHEIHTRDVFDGRPDNFFIRLRSMGSRLGITGTDGKQWSEQRNFVMKHLRIAGYGRRPMEEQIQIELDEYIDVIDNEIDGEEGIWPGELLSPSVLNILWTFIAGKKVKRTEERLIRLLDLLKLRSRAFDVSGGWLVSMPFLRYVAPEWSSYNLILQFNREIRQFIQDLIDEHRAEYTDDKANDDLIFAYLNEMKLREGKESNFTDFQLIMIILDLFIAGSHTTAITIDLALMMMVLHPKIQQRVHAEIDEVLGTQQYPTLKDKSRLSYTGALLLEVSRFFNITPTTGPRRTMQDTTLGGYDIPKNTTILIGMHSVSMDKEIWTDPDVFRPERFLDEDQNVINNPKLLTFGLGNRRCPGDNLARAALFTFFVGIMQKYRIELPAGGEMPTTKTVPGLLLSPKPYKVLFTKR